MSHDLDYDEMYKIVLVGDPGVGKTNLLAYFQADQAAQRPGADGAAATFKKARKPTVGTFRHHHLTLCLSSEMMIDHRSSRFDPTTTFLHLSRRGVCNGDCDASEWRAHQSADMGHRWASLTPFRASLPTFKNYFDYYYLLIPLTPPHNKTAKQPARRGIARSRAVTTGGLRGRC